ncbi:hypothetical protein C8Q76DRAFT_699265 [Earliella scabrosa]|nr:hypothetical protein C8Q76DRAFT_699265 [Earliella scabrosa]
MGLYEQFKLIDQQSNIADVGQLVAGDSVKKLRAMLNILKRMDWRIRYAINLRAPVNTLPAELLIDIFSLLLDPAHTETHCHEAVCGPYGLKVTSKIFPLGAVCRHWHQIIRNPSRLWTSVSLARDNADLRRGQGKLTSWPRLPVNIDIFAKEYIPDGPGLHVVADNYLYRPTDSRTQFFDERGEDIEELCVAVHPQSSVQRYRRRPFQLNWSIEDDADVLPPSLSFEPPTSLRRLIINADAPDGPQYTEHSLFGGHVLNISSLVMQNITFLPTNPMPTLTHLILLHSADRHTGRIPISGVLRLLSETPALREGYIEGIVATDLNPRAEEGELVVPLLHVRKLYISGVAVEQLLLRLQLPESCLLRLRVEMMLIPLERLRSAVSAMRWERTKVHCVWEAYCEGDTTLLVSLQAINRFSGGLRVELTSSRAALLSSSPFEGSPFADAEELWLSGGRATDLLRNLDWASSPLLVTRKLHLLNIISLDPPTGVLWPHATPAHLSTSGSPNLVSLHHYLRDVDHDLTELTQLLRARADAGEAIPHLVVSFYARQEDAESTAEVIETIKRATVSMNGPGFFLESVGLRKRFIHFGRLGPEVVELAKLQYSWVTILQ